MIKAILFDFDGTLADTAPGIVCTMQETFRQMRLRVPAKEEVTPTIGIPLFNAIKMLGGLDDDAARRGRDIYCRIFPQFELTHVSIFPEVRDTLERLAGKGIRMAICTSRNKESLELILSHHRLSDYFEICITNDDHLPSKPAPDMVLALLDRMGLSKDKAVVVGDTTFDIEMGNSAGCRTVAVTYGNHTEEKLQSVSPTWMAGRFSDLMNIL